MKTLPFGSPFNADLVPRNRCRQEFKRLHDLNDKLMQENQKLARLKIEENILSSTDP